MQRNGADAVIDRIVNSNEYDQQFGDWGVPGSGGMRFCPPGNRTAAAPVQAVPLNQRRFRAMDANNDGVISRNEWSGSRQHQPPDPDHISCAYSPTRKLVHL